MHITPHYVFRADKLDRVVFRVGVLAVLRSIATRGIIVHHHAQLLIMISLSFAAAVGVMITASHNPVQVVYHSHDCHMMGT